jgi:predicted transcriptional regulator
MRAGKLQWQSTYMAKAPFTMRLDTEIRTLGETVAKAEHRSLSNVIEAAILEYAEKRGFHRNPTLEPQPS